MPRNVPFCDRITRRDLLQVGAASTLGFALDLPGLLARQAAAATAGTRPRDDISFIFLFLKGGLSTIDTFDLKPNSPADIRGPFDPIATKVPGIQFGEDISRIAGQLDKFSLIRSFTHHDSNHGAADHYMLTGYYPRAGFNPSLSPNNQQPSFGSSIAHKLGPRGPMSPYVCLPDMHPSGGAAFLGPAAMPFVVNADPAAPNFAVPDLAPPLVIPADRLGARRDLLARVDRYQKSAESTANAAANTARVFREKAFELMTSPAAKQAFDIDAEPEELRDQYGRHTLGQSCLMARRLVEAGVRCVTITHSNWDTHSENFKILRQDLLPQFDSGFSTLLIDLAQRGMLERTLVVVTGEFGRTPRINTNAGRDHWGPCFSVALAGGGIQPGRVLGSSDRWAQKPTDNPVSPEDLASTMYHLLGMNPKEEILTPEGRPVPLVNGGRVIKELL